MNRPMTVTPVGNCPHLTIILRTFISGGAVTYDDPNLPVAGLSVLVRFPWSTHTVGVGVGPGAGTGAEPVGRPPPHAGITITSASIASAPTIRRLNPRTMSTNIFFIFLPSL